MSGRYGGTLKGRFHILEVLVTHSVLSTVIIFMTHSVSTYPAGLVAHLGVAFFSGYVLLTQSRLLGIVTIVYWLEDQWYVLQLVCGPGLHTSDSLT